MRFLSRLFGALATGHEILGLWDEHNGASVGAAGATLPGQALQVSVPAGQSATVAATPAAQREATPAAQREATPAAEGAATSAAGAARDDAGRFSSQQQQESGGQQQQAGSGVGGQPTGAAPAVQVTTPAPAGLNAEQLATLRASLVEANPLAVPELIQGDSFEELIASVPTAREAHSRVAAQVAEAAAGSVTRGGGTGGGAVDVDSLSGEAKIGVGLQQRRTR